MANLESIVKIRPSKKSVRHQYKTAFVTAALFTGLGFFLDYVRPEPKEADSQEESSANFAAVFTTFGLGLGLWMAGATYQDSRKTIIIDKDYRSITTVYGDEIKKQVRYAEIGVNTTSEWLSGKEGISFMTINYKRNDGGIETITTYQENAEELKKRILD